LAPSITATKALAVLSLAVLPPALALAGDSLERIVGTAQSIAGASVPHIEKVRAHCGSDAICAAKLLVEAIGPEARLERVDHPDTDQIRNVRSEPSVTGTVLSQDGTAQIKLDRFNRAAVREIRDSFENLTGSGEVRRLILDLRANQGGDFKRMLKLAALFTGPVPEAIHLHGLNGVTKIGIPQDHRLATGLPITVLVGPQTASSGEILAALLRVHAGAEIVGSRTFGKNYLHRIVPIDHDWRLLVPAERIEVPGTRIAGGLIPDRAN
jgi:C-terminal processing protease CtpA/Prc